MDKLYFGMHRGIVVSNFDSMGRCRVYVEGVYPEEFKNHPESLPIAEPMMPLFPASLSGTGSLYSSASGLVSSGIVTSAETINSEIEIPEDVSSIAGETITALSQGIGTMFSNFSSLLQQQPGTNGQIFGNPLGSCAWPEIGSIVWVFFEGGNHNFPIIAGSCPAGESWLSPAQGEYVSQLKGTSLLIDQNSLEPIDNVSLSAASKKLLDDPTKLATFLFSNLSHLSEMSIEDMKSQLFPSLSGSDYSDQTTINSLKKAELVQILNQALSQVPELQTLITAQQTTYGKFGFPDAATFSTAIKVLQLVSIFAPGITAGISAAITQLLQSLIGIKTKIIYDSTGKAKLQIAFGGDIEFLINGNITTIQNGSNVTLRSGTDASINGPGTSIAVPFMLNAKEMMSIAGGEVPTLESIDSGSGVESNDPIITDNLPPLDPTGLNLTMFLYEYTNGRTPSTGANLDANKTSSLLFLRDDWSDNHRINTMNYLKSLGCNTIVFLLMNPGPGGPLTIYSNHDIGGTFDEAKIARWKRWFKILCDNGMTPTPIWMCDDDRKWTSQSLASTHQTCITKFVQEFDQYVKYWCVGLESSKFTSGSYVNTLAGYFKSAGTTKLVFNHCAWDQGRDLLQASNLDGIAFETNWHPKEGDSHSPNEVASYVSDIINGGKIAIAGEYNWNCENLIARQQGRAAIAAGAIGAWTGF
jgi:hypothetical protein